jgi:hypothetical protein
MATSGMTTNLPHAVERIRPMIEAHATNAETNRQLSHAVYEAINDNGLFGTLAPQAHGGLEVHPVEAISAYAAWLPAVGVQELFRDGPPTVGGWQELSRDGAMVVSGRGHGAGQTSPRQTLLVKSKTRGKAVL